MEVGVERCLVVIYARIPPSPRSSRVIDAQEAAGVGHALPANTHWRRSVGRVNAPAAGAPAQLPAPVRQQCDVDFGVSQAYLLIWDCYKLLVRRPEIPAT